MTQDEAWMAKWKAVMEFIAASKRNPSRYNDEERGLYCNWLKHNRKLYAAGLMKVDRTEKFKELLSLAERYKHINQYA